MQPGLKNPGFFVSNSAPDCHFRFAHFRLALVLPKQIG
jgi:hypothetical protein